MAINPAATSRLSPDVKKMLALMADKTIPPLETLTIPEMRKAYKQIGNMLGGEPLAVHAVTALTVTEGPHAIPLRLYQPDPPGDEALPVTVYLHGGGWSVGDLDSHDRVCRRFARTTGYPVLAVDYRLAPEHPAPAGPDDVVSAIRWLAAHADELGLDASRIAVAGDSAGGSLAAVACQQLRAGEVTLRAQVLFYPSTDLSPSGDAFPSREQNGTVPPLTLSLMKAMSEPFVVGFDRRNPKVSPLQATDFTGLPPALIFTGECDVLRDDGRAYRDALQQAGVAVEYIEYPGMVHGFIEMAGVLPVTDAAIERAGEFLTEYFHR